MAFPFRFLKGCVFETPHKAVVNALERFLKPALDRIGWKWMQDFDPSVQQLDEFVGFGMSITAIWNNRTFLSALFYSLKASQGARIEGSERERRREREVRGRVRLRWHWSTGLGIRFSFVLFFVVEWRLLSSKRPHVWFIWRLLVRHAQPHSCLVFRFSCSVSSVKWVNKRLPSGIPFLNAFVMAVSGVNLLYLQLHFDIFFNSCCFPNPTLILELTLAAILGFFLNVCVDL